MPVRSVVHCLTAAALSAGPGLAATAKAGTARAASATRYTSFLIERLLSSSYQEDAIGHRFLLCAGESLARGMPQARRLARFASAPARRRHIRSGGQTSVRV